MSETNYADLLGAEFENGDSFVYRVANEFPEWPTGGNFGDTSRFTTRFYIEKHDATTGKVVGESFVDAATFVKTHKRVTR